MLIICSTGSILLFLSYIQLYFNLIMFANCSILKKMIFLEKRSAFSTGSNAFGCRAKKQTAGST